MLLGWKKKHEDELASAFKTPRFRNRASLSKKVHDLLLRNRQIFETYGPHSRSKDKLIADEADLWRVYVKTDVIPNNRRITELLGANLHLLKPSEKAILGKFNLHREGLELNHLSANKTASVPLFPRKMNTILKGGN